jgi:hypothetical protein
MSQEQEFDDRKLYFGIQEAVWSGVPAEFVCRVIPSQSASVEIGSTQREGRWEYPVTYIRKEFPASHEHSCKLLHCDAVQSYSSVTY